MSNGYVVSAFAGLGKTYLAKYNDKFIDLESSDYQWLENDKYGDKEQSKGNTEKVKNPSFPNNYVEEMKKLVAKGKVPLIAAQPEVIEAASKAGLYIVMAYPSLDSKKDILKRYKDRGNAAGFIKLMEGNFEKFVESMKSNVYAIFSIEVEKGEFLTDYLTNEDLDDIIGEELAEAITPADIIEAFLRADRDSK